MIITLTPNPAVDQTIFVDRLEVGEVNRFRESQLDPAGKGINVSRVAHRLRWPTIAFGFLAGEIGLIAEKALDDEGVQHHFVRVPGQTRINVTIIDEINHTGTSLYGPGPPVDQEHRARLDDLIQFWLQSGRVLVLAGSLPPGMPEDAYATYVRLAHSKGVNTILDTDGVPLLQGADAKPYLIKPNVAEAERLLGRSLPDLEAVVQGAKELASRGIAVVVISMGVEGAICAHDGKIWQAMPPKVQRRSTVGSGDSLVAGLAVALARGEDIVEGLRLGTAAGAATAMTPGTALGTPDEVVALLPQVQVKELT
ncbi:MAG: 1-phosphofructokinase [Chloroflexi bacterium]|nr:1-phosphofructokinase [Chloroflexota bacterium]